MNRCTSQLYFIFCFIFYVIQQVLKQYNIVALPLESEGVWGTLYASIRKEDLQQSYFMHFIKLTRQTINIHLEGIIPIDTPLEKYGQ